MDDASGYPDYKQKLLRWSRITKIAKNKQAEYVVYHLEEHPSRIQEKIDTALGAEIEDQDDGMDKLIAFLDGIYAEDEMSEAWHKYKDFIRLKRGRDQPVNEFIAEFDKKHKRANESGCQFSDMVLGFNLLEACNLTETDEKFVLTAVDFRQGKAQRDLVDQIKNSLRKFQSRDSRLHHKDAIQFKQEDVFVSSVKEALVAEGWTPPSSSAAKGVKKNSSVYKGRKNPLGKDGRPLRCFRCDSEYHMSDTCDVALDRGDVKGGERKKEKEKKKRKKKNGDEKVALSDSHDYLESDGGTALSKVLARASVSDFNMLCVDSDPSPSGVDPVNGPIENQMLLSDLLTRYKLGDLSRDGDVDACSDRELALMCGEVIDGEGLECVQGPMLLSDLLSQLRQGDNTTSVATVDPSIECETAFVSLEEQQLCLLIEEAGSRGVLDTACSRSVAGFVWVQNYTTSVSPQFAETLKVNPSTKIYQFGGGERRLSQGTLSLPVVLGDKKMNLTIEIVDAQIPLLIGSNSMKHGNAVIDFTNNTATFFDEVVGMTEVGAGHFCIDLCAPHVATHINDNIERDNVVYHVLMAAEVVDMKLLKKLHHYYGHTPPDRLLKFLKKAGKDVTDLRKPLLEIEKTCEACIRTKKRSPKPKSAIPRVDTANAIVTLDLKEWSFKGSKYYICYMIDMFSRLTMGNFIKNKNPESIVECILGTWVPAFGLMRGIHSDIGGEFSNSTLEEVASRLGVEITTTASYSPNQNGLNERNHAIVDMMLSRMLLSDPTLKPHVALCWALNAKNSLENCYGFTPFQLHIGRTPMLPSATRDGPPSFENVSKSENFAAHLNALHAARAEFIKAESSKSLKLALKSKVFPRGEDVTSGDDILQTDDAFEKHRAMGRTIKGSCH